MTGAQVCLDDFRLKLEAQLALLALAQLRLIRLQHRRPGAYTVRYLFVIYGFLVTGTEDLGARFLLGRAVEAGGSEPF
jgi:hypothetical protein